MTEQEQVIPKRRGRPPGSKNTPKEVAPPVSTPIEEKEMPEVIEDDMFSEYEEAFSDEEISAITTAPDDPFVEPPTPKPAAVISSGGGCGGGNLQAILTLAQQLALMATNMESLANMITNMDARIEDMNERLTGMPAAFDTILADHYTELGKTIFSMLTERVSEPPQEDVVIVPPLPALAQSSVLTWAKGTTGPYPLKKWVEMAGLKLRDKGHDVTDEQVETFLQSPSVSGVILTITAGMINRI